MEKLGEAVKRVMERKGVEKAFRLIADHAYSAHISGMMDRIYNHKLTKRSLFALSEHSVTTRRERFKELEERARMHWERKQELRKMDVFKAFWKVTRA